MPYQGPATQYQWPYGAHLRLKATFDDSTFGPQSKAIVAALEHFGAYIADTGNADNPIYTANPESGDSSLWDLEDLHALDAVHLSDFEVLTVGPTTSK